MRNDPGNLVSRQPARAKELQGLLRGWQESVVDRLQGNDCKEAPED